ncbi:oligopeptide transporter [Lactarius indigo]|nr:oligopeptide transporter [Lactarius indigo]
MTELQDVLPTLPLSSETSFKEKNPRYNDENEKPLFDGEPVITSGRDVSQYLVDLRDDEDPPFTFRSIVLGTMIGGLGAALYQCFFCSLFTQWGCSGPPFSHGVLGQKGRDLNGLDPTLHFVNPGRIQAQGVASSASWGSTAVLNFAVQRVRAAMNSSPLSHRLSCATRPSSYTMTRELPRRQPFFRPSQHAVFGYGIVGILRPLTVYPSELVYWGNLPTVSIFQALHFDSEANHKRVRLFWIAFAVMFVYEVIPSYIFPLLNGFSIFCLASQHASPRVQDVFTNIFGGADGNEGLGLFSLSFDWQYIGSGCMSLPLIQQANTWIGIFICYIAIAAIYYSNTWNASGPNFQLNQTALDEIGLPALTGSNAWAGLTSSLAIGEVRGGSVVVVYPPFALSSSSLVSSACSKARRRCPVWSYIVALISGAIVAPFSTLINGRMGSGVGTGQLFKMIAGAINPGRPVANLYFSMWSHDVVSTTVGFSGDLKIGQYLKVWGTIIGAVVNYVVMISITGAQRDLLLDPTGNNIWNGQTVQSLNSNAITWSLAKDLYGPSGPYFVIPMGIFIGFAVTAIHWLINKRWPYIGPVRVDRIILPLIIHYSASLFWLRQYHPGWYRKYNYILGGALDGGAQVMIFILSFAVFGASGVSRPFPTWAGNPAKGNVDYCNGNGALD